jgi:general secretion pathway protein K
MWIRPAAQKRGSALLAVLWLSAALAAIALSLSNTVRGETERASTSSDGLKAYYMAAGAVQEAALRMLWQRQFTGTAGITGNARYEFPNGVADVEVIPETSKIDINSEKPEGLFRLLVALGTDATRARDVALAIQDWRTLLPEGVFSEFDSYYLSQVPSFRARHASFQEIEELLLVRGVTPELYYGTYVPNPRPAPGEPRLARRGGLADCVSVFGGGAGFDINTARPEVLEAIGVAPDLVASIVARRRISPFTMAQMGQLMQEAGPAGARLRVGATGSIFTVRATARLRVPGAQLSDLRRTVAAMVKYMPEGYDSPMHFLRWYDTAWSN